MKRVAILLLILAGSVSAEQIRFEKTPDLNSTFTKKYEINLAPDFPNGGAKSIVIQLADNRYMMCFIMSPWMCFIADREDWVRCKMPDSPDILECTSSEFGVLK